MPDLNAASLEAAMSMIKGTARSMGIEVEDQWETLVVSTTRRLIMPKRGKKYLEALKLIDKEKLYDVDEALSLVLKTASAKFDETVELAMRLGVDPRHADQQVRGTVVLPNGTGKSVKVLVLAKGDKVKEALEAGADYASGCLLYTSPSPRDS